jgi:hypothetical protein
MFLVSPHTKVAAHYHHQDPCSSSMWWPRGEVGRVWPMKQSAFDCPVAQTLLDGPAIAELLMMPFSEKRVLRE